MAFNRSINSHSTARHQENIKFLEDVMLVNNITGTTSLALLHDMNKKFNDLCTTISKKSIDEIDRSEVDGFILLNLQIIDLQSKLNISDQQRQEVLTPTPKIVGERHKTAYIKVISREEMALKESTFSTSKERHQRNILILKGFVKPEDISR